jgi:hypothetical protein
MRRFAAIMATASLLLFLLAVVMWIRCRWWQETLTHVSIDTQKEVKWQIESSNGQISLVRMTGNRSYFFGDTPGWHLSRNDMIVRGGRYGVNIGGSGQRSYYFSYAGQIYSRGVALPYWIILLLTAILPALWLRDHLAGRRRSQTGLCQSCGYNLTGNTSGVCPECGQAIKAG